MSNERKPIVHVIPANPKLQKRKRVAIYCRVSTEAEQQYNSLQAQMDFLKQDILENLDWKYIATYSDTKSGRTINSRPGFKKMMEACEAGEIDLIYTKSISRFGRDCLDFLVTLRRLKELKIDVYFQNENIFLLQASGELLLTFHALVAQSESANKGENIKWGIRRSTMNPDSPAFSRKCFGYDKDENGKLIINSEEAAVVNTIYELYGDGHSIIRIKKELENRKIPTPTGKRKWAVKTIDNILTNEKYNGDSVYGTTVAREYPSIKRDKNLPEEIRRSENHHPAIIDRHLFDQVQIMKKKRSNIEIDADGNTVRKSTHYSIKSPKIVVKKITKPFNE